MKFYFKNRIYFIFLTVIFSVAILHADPFEGRILKEEAEKLESGQIVIRNIHSAGNISIKSENEQVKKAVETIRSLNPSYLAEVIYKCPVKENEDISSRISSLLADIPSYKGIPYYSEHNDVWVDLYSNAGISDIKTYEDSTKSSCTIKAELYMDPFGDITSDIRIDHDFSERSLYYENMNVNDILYSGMTCIKSGNMKSVIVVYKDEGCWILYGIGGVAAPRIPFLTKRIELSFMNRIKTFCSFIFSKL